MKHLKKNDGFTLVELMVTLVAASVVTFAAASLLLMGTKIQYVGNKSASEQQTVRIVLRMLENMASSGEIDRIESSATGWKLLKEEGEPNNPEDDKTLFEYKTDTQTVSIGDGAELLSGLASSEVAMQGNTLRFTFSTEQGNDYETAVYCRVGVTQTTENAAMILDDVNTDSKTQADMPADEAAKRIAFLKTLASEYGGGNNQGIILNGTDGGKYYSEWYIGSETFGTNGWGPNTPWCACFVSWAAVKGGIIPEEQKDTSPYIFANVDTGVAAFETARKWKPTKDVEGNIVQITPTPGDYIFFDWTGNRSDASHVGVVLDVRDGYIYTIEGNSGNRVAVRRYAADSPDIMGYGTLPFS